MIEWSVIRLKISENMITAHYPAAARNKKAGPKSDEKWNAHADASAYPEQKTQMSGGAFELHISNGTDGEAVSAACGADYSVTVYRPKDFDPANPVYRVKVWDREGNTTERMVDVSQVNPTDCDYLDMFAYSSHLSATGECRSAQSAFTHSAKNPHGADDTTYRDLFQATNWVSRLTEAMQTQYDAGNIEGYLHYKPFWDFLRK